MPLPALITAVASTPFAAVRIGGLTFAAPWWLLLLLALPVVLLLRLLLARWRRNASKRLVGRAAANRASGVARGLKLGLLLGALALIAVATARPQWGSRPVLLPREGTDVVIALDTSASMLATDVEPNRFEHAKLVISRLLDQLQGDRVGLVVFAGSATVRFPLTTDVGAARELIQGTAIREGNLRPGTGIGDALRTAATAFGEDAARSKLVVLISDGEDLAGDAQTQEGLRNLRDQGATLYTIGLGTEAGSQLAVPDPRTGQVRPRVDPTTNQPAVSRANEALLRQLASAGDGRFYNGNGDSGATTLAREIASLERTRFQSQEGSEPIERSMPFVVVAIILLALELVIPERRRRRAVPAERPATRRAA